MEIRFISSVTPEDENVYAPTVLKTITAILDKLPIAYTLRIETAGAQVFQHTHPSVGDVKLRLPIEESVLSRLSRD